MKKREEKGKKARVLEGERGERRERGKRRKRKEPVNELRDQELLSIHLVCETTHQDHPLSL
jgi:hypothetical protein